MAIKATGRGGAGAGRGDDPHYADYAKRMGVPKQWVTGPGTAKFTGSVAGFTGAGGAGNVWFTAESTGGGESDSHQIPFSHPSMDTGEAWRFDKHFGVNRQNPSAGRKWTAEGKHVPVKRGNEWVNEMQWNLYPADMDKSSSERDMGKNASERLG